MVKTLAVFVFACILPIHSAWGPELTGPQQVGWVTESTVLLIKHFEGKRHKAYQDSQGNWTIGVGHLIKRKDHHLLHTELTEQEVMGILHRDLKVCSQALQNVLQVDLKRSQIDALYSLCHNIGPDNFKKSEVVKHLNKGETEKAANAFMNWSRPEVLKNRRQAEKALFLKDI
jgi:lysozyme